MKDIIERIDILLINEDYEYTEYCRFVDSYLINMNEGLFSRISKSLNDKIDFIKEIAAQTKANFTELLKLFKNSKVFKFFSKIGWSFKKLFELLSKGFKLVHTVLNVISEYISNSKVGKWTEEKLKDLDKFLQNHPKTRRIAGIAVACILAYIWFNMSFTGDFSYDFGMDDLIAALAGKFTLANLFAGTNGVKLLLLFATGMIGISFPWPGPGTVKFVSAILQTLIRRLKINVRLRFSN